MTCIFIRTLLGFPAISQYSEQIWDAGPEDAFSNTYRVLEICYNMCYNMNVFTERQESYSLP